MTTQYSIIVPMNSVAKKVVGLPEFWTVMSALELNLELYERRGPWGFWLVICYRASEKNHSREKRQVRGGFSARV